MSKPSSVIAGVVGVSLLTCGLVFRAVTVHSVPPAPLIYRVVANNNDLDAVEGFAVPRRTIELWYKQRTFREGSEGGSDRFSLCAWKNGGQPVRLGITVADDSGLWRLKNLRAATTVMLFPAVPSSTECSGGVLTQLLPRACDGPGVNCSDWTPPKLHWLNVKKQTTNVATAAGAISDAYQAAIAVADGPNDGPEPTDLVDVDSNGLSTTVAGFTAGQKVVWKCGAGGTAVCPAAAVHDGTTISAADPEYPFILGTMQGHAPGGSIFAAAAIQRGEPLGFTVNVNLRFRGLVDVNLGCDQAKFFDFSVPLLN
jgi:hypothetical protein